jgi:hypothetical protein
MSAVEYGERYVAFADIIGWRGLIQELETGAQDVAFLKSLLERVHKPVSPDTLRPMVELRLQSISDAVVISADVSGFGLMVLLEALEILSLDLLERGYFVRGGVTRARLYHDDLMVFGRGLVDAYELESKLAVVPRILIADEVLKDAAAYFRRGWPEYWLDKLLRDHDGRVFLNVLKQVVDEVAQNVEADDGDRKSPMSSRHARMKAQIERRLLETASNPRHFEKTRWFAAYWNAAVPSPKFTAINVAGMALSAPITIKPVFLWKV